MKKATKYIFTVLHVFLAVLIVLVLLASVANFIAEFFLNFLVGIIGFYFSAYGIGQNLYRIKKSNQKYTVIHGIGALVLVFALGIVLGSTVGFAEALLHPIPNHTINDYLYDYYFKPIYWLLFYGGIPILFCGLILGIYLKEIEQNEC